MPDEVIDTLTDEDMVAVANAQVERIRELEDEVKNLQYALSSIAKWAAEALRESI